MMQQRWLSRVEAGAIAASIAGAITTALTQQVLFAVTPLLVTVGLSAAQRRQLLQHTQTLEHSLTTLAAQAKTEETETLPALQSRLATLEVRLQDEQQAQSDVALAVQTARSRLDTLQTQVQALTTLPETVTALHHTWETWQAEQLPQTLEPLQVAVQALREEWAAGQQATPAWEKPLDELHQAISQIQQRQQDQWDAIAAQLHPLAEKPWQATLEPLTQQLQTLRDRLVALEESLARPEGVHGVQAESAPLIESDTSPAETPLEPTVEISHDPTQTVSPEDAWAEEAQATPAESASEHDAPSPSPVENEVRKAHNPPEPPHLPPTVPAAYRRESLTPETEPAATSLPEEEPEEPCESETVDFDPDPTEQDTTGRDRVLTPEIEAGVREIGKNLWQMGRSLRDSLSQLASSSGLSSASEAELHTSEPWQMTPLMTLPDFSPQAIALSGSGRYVAYCTMTGTVQLFDLEQLRSELTLSPEAAAVTAIAFSPDAELLLVGQSNGQSVLWSRSSQTAQQTLKGHELPVTTVAFSPHGKTCATGSADKMITLWDVNTGHALRTLPGHWDRVIALQFSPDGQSLVSGSLDGTVKRWHIATGEKVANAVPGGVVRSVAVSADGQLVANGCDRRLQIWQSNTLSTVQDQRLFKAVRGVQFAPQGERVAAIAGSTVQLWTARSGQRAATLQTEQAAIAVQWLPEPDALLVVTETGQVQRWQREPEA